MMQDFLPFGALSPEQDCKTRCSRLGVACAERTVNDGIGDKTRCRGRQSRREEENKWEQRSISRRIS